MNTATKPKAKLAPLTITITDQRVLKRLHKVAARLREKPERLAETVMTCGLWDWPIPTAETHHSSTPRPVSAGRGFLVPWRLACCRASTLLALQAWDANPLTLPPNEAEVAGDSIGCSDCFRIGASRGGKRRSFSGLTPRPSPYRQRYPSFRESGTKVCDPLVRIKGTK